MVPPTGVEPEFSDLEDRYLAARFGGMSRSYRPNAPLVQVGAPACDRRVLRSYFLYNLGGEIENRTRKPTVLQTVSISR